MESDTSGRAAAKTVYYLVMSVCFRLAFSNFEIPNSAFGAEIAQGYDARTRLRTVTRIFSIIGNALGYVMPLLILDLFPENEAAGWRTIGLILAAVCFGIGFAALQRFPINKKTFGSLTEALRLRREGKDYSAYLDDVRKVI